MAPQATEAPESSKSTSGDELPPTVVDTSPVAAAAVTVDPVVEASPAVVEPTAVTDPVADPTDELTSAPKPQSEAEAGAEVAEIPAPADVAQEVVADPAVANEPTPVEQYAPTVPEPPVEVTADESFLQSVIDGQVDIFDPALSVNIEAVLTRNPDNAEILAKWKRAVSTYTAAMTAAASQTLSK